MGNQQARRSQGRSGSRASTPAVSQLTPFSTAGKVSVALLGDSTLDNILYVDEGGSKGRDVTSHLSELLGIGSKVVLCAEDGALCNSIAKLQLSEVPRGTTHLVVSVGGNDGLRALGSLKKKVGTVHDALVQLREVQLAFEMDYGAMLDSVVALGKPTLILQQYLPRMTHFAQFHCEQAAAEVFVSILMDSLVVAARQRRLPLLDLRTVMTEAADYANPIEPSDQGGRKIARAIADTLRQPGSADDQEAKQRG